MAINTFRDLDVWQCGMQLALVAYRVTEAFPQAERYGLISQIRRAATSIPANLAEGHGRPRAAYRNHVSIAIGSQAELDTLVELSRSLGYLQAEDHSPIAAQLAQVGQMLHGLARALNQNVGSASYR